MIENDRSKIETTAGDCDIKVWCGDCKRDAYTTSGEKYLCATCGKILNMGHQVRHEIFPHVSGDPDQLS